MDEPPNTLSKKRKKLEEKIRKFAELVEEGKRIESLSKFLEGEEEKRNVHIRMASFLNRYYNGNNGKSNSPYSDWRTIVEFAPYDVERAFYGTLEYCRKKLKALSKEK